MGALLLIPFLPMLIINGPLLFLNVFINLFYVFCLLFPRHSGVRKQPLTALLGFLISCSLLYCAAVICMGINGLLSNYSQILIMVTTYFVDYSIVSYVWLTFYYYIQIVPARSAPFLWVKRNIRCTIYLLMVFDIFFTAFCRIVVYGKYLLITSSLGLLLNDTATVESYERSRLSSFYMTMTHYTVMLCVVMASSFSTVRYLREHISNMGKSGAAFSAAKLRGQMRVTVTGTCQGLLFFLYGNFVLFDGFFLEFSKLFYRDSSIAITVTTLFIAATTLTLGIGQNAFRQRVVDTYKALKCLSVCKKSK